MGPMPVSLIHFLVLICLVNKSPDYSAAFVILRTNIPNLKAYGLILFSMRIVQRLTVSQV